jgi:ribosomal protein L11 methyltransferase
VVVKACTLIVDARFVVIESCQMSLFELIVLAPVGEVETVSEALEALDALSVSVEDADALFGEPGMPPPKAGWERSRIVSLFDTEASAKGASQLLQAQDFFEDCTVLGVKPVPEQDWVRLTQSQFTPVEITPAFWIVPTWHEPPAQARQLIRLDPGLAFGTGTHPTTRMCLKWIANSGGNGVTLGRVLDYGCGSGILAIGAAKFGAVDIDAVDIDPAAVVATVANAQANHVMLNAGLPDQANGQYNTVLANILATPLRVLAPLLTTYARGGSLVLAGILSRQAEELKTAYAPYCALEVSDEEEGWILMTARC